jgi:ABC-type Fe3+-siderophore transport system permease subunit
MAAFYARAISPTLVIRKTFVYGVTVALLLFAYATMESCVANPLADKIGLSNSFANAMLGTVLALAFQPTKNRMEHALKRVGTTANRATAER